MKCHDVPDVCSCNFNMATLIVQFVLLIMRLFGA